MRKFWADAWPVVFAALIVVGTLFVTWLGTIGVMSVPPTTDGYHIDAVPRGYKPPKGF